MEADSVGIRRKAMNISVDSETMSGTPCFTGTRVPIGVLFDNLAAGSTLDDILDDWPTIGRERAIAVLHEAQAALERNVRGSAPNPPPDARTAVIPNGLMDTYGVPRTPNPPPDPSTAVSPSTSIGYEKLSWLPRRKKK